MRQALILIAYFPVDVKKGSLWTPLFTSAKTKLLVVDVHGDFKAKANVTVFWSFPFHVNSPHII